MNSEYSQLLDLGRRAVKSEAWVWFRRMGAFLLVDGCWAKVTILDVDHGMPFKWHFSEPEHRRLHPGGVEVRYGTPALTASIWDAAIPDFSCPATLGLFEFNVLERFEACQSKIHVLNVDDGRKEGRWEACNIHGVPVSPSIGFSPPDDASDDLIRVRCLCAALDVAAIEEEESYESAVKAIKNSLDDDLKDYIKTMGSAAHGPFDEAMKVLLKAPIYWHYPKDKDGTPLHVGDKVGMDDRWMTLTVKCWNSDGLVEFEESFIPVPSNLLKKLSRLHLQARGELKRIKGGDWVWSFDSDVPWRVANFFENGVMVNLEDLWGAPRLTRSIVDIRLMKPEELLKHEIIDELPTDKMTVTEWADSIRACDAKYSPYNQNEADLLDLSEWAKKPATLTPVKTKVKDASGEALNVGDIVVLTYRTCPFGWGAWGIVQEVWSGQYDGIRVDLGDGLFACIGPDSVICPRYKGGDPVRIGDRVTRPSMPEEILTVKGFFYSYVPEEGAVAQLKFRRSNTVAAYTYTLSKHAEGGDE